MKEETESDHCDKLQEQVEEAAAKLGEMFDGVIIIATASGIQNGSDGYFAAGSGNVFTRLGMAREYLIRNDESTRIDKRTQREE